MFEPHILTLGNEKSVFSVFSADVCAGASLPAGVERLSEEPALHLHPGALQRRHARAVLQAVCETGGGRGTDLPAQHHPVWGQHCHIILSLIYIYVYESVICVCRTLSASTRLSWIRPVTSPHWWVRTPSGSRCPSGRSCAGVWTLLRPAATTGGCWRTNSIWTGEKVWNYCIYIFTPFKLFPSLQLPKHTLNIKHVHPQQRQALWGYHHLFLFLILFFWNISRMFSLHYCLN